MAVKRTKGKKPDNIIVNNIQVMNTSHASQDIEMWKNAIRAFENVNNPIRTNLYDLYFDIELDGQIEATWGKRLDAILNKNLVFVRDGMQDDNVSRLLNCPDMRGIIKELLNTIAWGYTLIQVNGIWYDEDQESYKIDYDLIPRKHVHPERGLECISRQQGMTTKDWLYKEAPLCNYMIWAGDPKDKGLFVKAVQYVIYKRGGFGDWSQFAEMFGMPFREMIYDDYDESTRNKLIQGLEDWGGAGYSIHPRSSELKIHDTGGSTGSNEVYDAIIKACDTSISKVILGNTLTTEQGENGARSLGEVHQDVEDAKHESDMKFILDILNTQFRAVMKRFGINVSGGEIIFQTPDKDWDRIQTKWNVISSISDKVPVSDDFIYEEFDVPKPDNYDELKEELRMKHSFNPFAADTGSMGENNPLRDGKPKPDNLLGRVFNFFV